MLANLANFVKWIFFSKINVIIIVINMKVLYLYMFPLWGNGSGNWLRRLTANLKSKYGDNYQAAIVAPDSRFLKHKQAIHAV